MRVDNTRAFRMVAAMAGLFPGIIAAQFVYVPTNESRIYGYRVDGSNGALAPLAGSPFSGNGFAEWSVATPSGRYLYTVDTSAFWDGTKYTGGVHGFRIDTQTGSLSPTGFPTARAGIYPSKVNIDPSGRFLYALNYNSANISAYAVNESNGELTEIPGSPFATAPYPVHMAMDPAGKFLYTSSPVQDAITGFAINSSTGALTAAPGSPFHTPARPAGLAVHPSGRFVYLASYSNVMVAYAVDSASGALSPVTQGFPISTQPTSVGVAIDPTGRFLYVANQDPKSISAYTVDASSGRVTEVAGSPFANDSFAWVLVIHPGGRYLYAVNYYPGTISAYSINASTGALARISGSPFAAYQYASNLSIAGTCQSPPMINDARATPEALWPPNQRMTPVFIGYSAYSRCGGTPACSLSVAVNEPGYANTGDWVVLGDHEVLLRAERGSEGGVRSYVITISCRDTAGNVGNTSVTVSTQHDQGK